MTALTLRLRAAASGLALTTAALASAAPAYAVDPIYAGGASLPAELARDLADCFAVPFDTNGSGTNNDADRPALCTDPYGAYDATGSAVQILYASLGSGAGRTAVRENTPLVGTPGTPPPPSSNLFSFPFPDHHFSLSEAPFTVTNPRGGVGDELTDYDTDQDGAGPDVDVSALNGPLIQVPFVGTPVAIAFNRQSLDASVWNAAIPAGGSSGVELSRAGYCALWGGYADGDNWKDAVFKRSNGGSQVSNGSLPITRVARNDSSGTTFIFTSRLAQQCADTPYPWPYATSVDFEGNVVGTTTVAWATPLFTTAPSGETLTNRPVLRADQNSGVANCLAGAWTDVDGDLLCGEATVAGEQGNPYSTGRGRVGYASPSFVEPLTDNDVVTANLASAFAARTYLAPTTTNTSRALINIDPPADLSDQVAWGLLQTAGDINSPSARGAYPLVGFNYIDAFTCYEDFDVYRGVRDFFNFYLSNTAQVNNIMASKGFVPINPDLRTGVRSVALQDASTKLRQGPVAGVCSVGG